MPTIRSVGTMIGFVFLGGSCRRKGGSSSICSGGRSEYPMLLLEIESEDSFRRNESGCVVPVSLSTEFSPLSSSQAIILDAECQ